MTDSFIKLWCPFMSLYVYIYVTFPCNFFLFSKSKTFEASFYLPRFIHFWRGIGWGGWTQVPRNFVCRMTSLNPPLILINPHESWPTAFVSFCCLFFSFIWCKEMRWVVVLRGLPCPIPWIYMDKVWGNNLNQSGNIYICQQKLVFLCVFVILVLPATNPFVYL